MTALHLLHLFVLFAISSPRAKRGISTDPVPSPTIPLGFTVPVNATRPTATMDTSSVSAPTKAYTGEQWDGGAAGYDKWVGTLETFLGVCGCLATIYAADFYGVNSDGAIVTGAPDHAVKLSLDLQSRVALWMLNTLQGKAKGVYDRLRAAHRADAGTPRAVPTAYELFTELSSDVSPEASISVLTDVHSDLHGTALPAGATYDTAVQWLDSKYVLRSKLAEKGDVMSDILYLSTIYRLLTVNYTAAVATTIRSNTQEHLKAGLEMHAALKASLEVQFPQRHGHVPSPSSQQSQCPVHRPSQYAMVDEQQGEGFVCHHCKLRGHREFECQLKQKWVPQGELSARERREARTKERKTKDKKRGAENYVGCGQASTRVPAANGQRDEYHSSWAWPTSIPCT